MADTSPLALVLLAVSATVQAFATLWAIRVAVLSKPRAPWILLASGLAAATVRRGIALGRALLGTSPGAFHLGTEVVDLVASILLCLAVVMLLRVARSARQREPLDRERDNQAAFSLHNPAPTLRVDPSGTVVLANPAARLFGIDVGRPLTESLAELTVDLPTVIGRGTTHAEHTDASGRTLHLTIRGLPELGVANVYASDITELKQTQDALRRTNEELRRWVGELERNRQDSDAHIELTALLQSCESVEEAGHVTARLVPSVFPETSGALFLESAHPGALSCVGRWGDEAPAHTSFHRDTCWALRRGHTHASEVRENGLSCPHLVDGYEGYSVCLPLRALGAMPGVLTLRGEGRLRDIGGQRQARMLADTVGLAVVNLRLRESLREQSIRDALTGLFNRRYLEETLTREVARSARDSAPLSLLMIDLDRFKTVNDSFGHAAGDRVLQLAGELLQRHVRAGDIVCRYGGEEFAVLMPDTDAEHAVSRAEELRRGAHALEVPDAPIAPQVSFSIGVACYPEHARRAPDLLNASDAALYMAKRNGRDRVEVAPGAGLGALPAETV